MILLDANVLVRLSDKDDPEYSRAQRVVYSYRAVDEVVLAPQTLYEFWAVATRGREVNGVGMNIARARLWITTCQRMFRVLPEPLNLLTTWGNLVETYAITGFRAHDARYVAMMQVHGIRQIITYNAKHFASYPITVINPAVVGKAN